MRAYFGSYTTVGSVILAGLAFVVVAFTANRLIRPQRPGREKYLTYECGIDPVGAGWSQTQIRYYVFAFLFVIFDVESVFLFPFAAVLNGFTKAGYGTAVFVEMVVFIAILVVGLLYAWKKKVLEWV
ncbi:MAG TPA: NADH-quinone oxidoreductase subunit A [Frankiaceae bacterium]|jgi:NADH-quinone oxidoreductase subunit A|nr:NADH-quinone oxidoreductase subunit A [Frankiaceae bacterium]